MLGIIGDISTMEVSSSLSQPRIITNTYSGFAAQSLSLIALFLLYHPPQHPKGVPWREGLAGLDYVGALLITPGVVLTLVGIIFTVSLNGLPMCRIICSHTIIDLQKVN
jgi:hypothetical protein